MFTLTTNVRDMKRMFGMVRCGGDRAKVILQDDGLCIESDASVVVFVRATTGMSSIKNVAGYGDFVVNIDDVLNVLSAGRVDDEVWIWYTGGVLKIVVGNVASVVATGEREDMSKSKIIDQCRFGAYSDVRGRDFITLMKSSNNAKASQMVVSNEDDTFRIESIGGEYSSYIEWDNYGDSNRAAMFSTEFLVEFSKCIRVDDRMHISIADNRPMRIRMDVGMWSLDYLIAPRVDSC